jgi:hypothetical protein
MKKFLKEWGVLVGFAAAALAGTLGVRLWSDVRANDPIIPAYQGMIDYLAKESPKAGQYRQSYYDKFQRSTVASKHFEHVCGAMIRLAETDGKKGDGYSETMTRGCREFMPSASDIALPPS